MQEEYKQVIVIRKDLEMRKGKFVAQGAHAARGASINANYEVVSRWERQGETKIVVGISGRENLLSLYNEARSDELPCKLVRDAARTEFDEEKLTAVAIGPAKAGKVDKHTGNLELL